MAIGTPIVRAIDIDPVLTRSAGIGEATGHAPAAHHGGRGMRSRTGRSAGSFSAPPCRRSAKSCLALAWLIHPQLPRRMAHHMIGGGNGLFR